MTLKDRYIHNYLIRLLAFLVCIAAFTACTDSSVDELTYTNPYARIIGTEYRIVSGVNAYGIYKNLDDTIVSYIDLIPGVGIGGPEVAFKRGIVKGQKIKILSAWRERKLLGSDVYYVVALQNAGLPRDVPVQIELSRGNEGVDGGLNPRFYEKLAK